MLGCKFENIKGYLQTERGINRYMLGCKLGISIVFANVILSN